MDVRIPLGSVCYTGDIVRCAIGVGVVTHVEIDRRFGVEDSYDIFVPELDRLETHSCWDVEKVARDEAPIACVTLSDSIKARTPE